MQRLSIGIFSWSSLEPAEGRFEFDWLDTIMDKLATNNAFAILATPSGSKPAWMSRAYPEIRRVGADGVRQLNHDQDAIDSIRKGLKAVEILPQKNAKITKTRRHEFGSFCGHCVLLRQASISIVRARTAGGSSTATRPIPMRWTRWRR